MTKAQSTYRNTYHAITTGVWAIEPSALPSLYAQAQNFLSGNFQAFDENEEEEYQATTYEEDAVVAVISLKGTVFKNDTLCDYGTQTLARRIEALDRDKKVSAILLKIDSPGGQFDGTGALAKTLSNCSKPTMAFVDDGLCCSAGYYIASHAQEVWASKQTDRIGSIGTFITLADYKELYEKAGVKIHEIYADKSTDKNKTYHEAIQGKYEPIKNEMLNPLNEEFLAAVQAARPNIKKETLTGKVYLAKDAIALGLIDRIGSYADAVAHLASKVQKTNPSSNVNSTMATNFLSKLFQSAKTEEEAATQLEEQLAQSAHYQSVVAENAQLKAQVSTLEQRITTLEAENAKFSAIAGDVHTKVQGKEVEETALSHQEPTANEIISKSPWTQRSKEIRGEE